MLINLGIVLMNVKVFIINQDCSVPNAGIVLLKNLWSVIDDEMVQLAWNNISNNWIDSNVLLALVYHSRGNGIDFTVHRLRNTYGSGGGLIMKSIELIRRILYPNGDSEIIWEEKDD